MAHPRSKPEDKFDYETNVVLIGDSAVGKSMLVSRFVKDEFKMKHVPTIGIDYAKKIINESGKKIKLNIYDCSGDERFSQVTSAYLRKADTVMIVCDKTNYQSLKNLRLNMLNIEGICREDIKVILVGNKADKVDKLEIPLERLYKCSEKYKCECIETSAENCTNTDELFQKAAKNRIKKVPVTVPSLPKPIKSSSIKDFFKKHWSAFIAGFRSLADKITSFFKHLRCGKSGSDSKAAKYQGFGSTLAIGQSVNPDLTVQVATEPPVKNKEPQKVNQQAVNSAIPVLSLPKTLRVPGKA